MKKKWQILIALALTAVMLSGCVAGPAKSRTIAPFGNGGEVDFIVIKSPVSGKCYEVATASGNKRMTGLGEVDCQYFKGVQP